MEMVFGGVGLLLGFLLGFIWARSQIQHRSQSAAERIQFLEVERSQASDAVARSQQEILELNRKLSGMEARQPQIEKLQQELQAERDLLIRRVETQQNAVSQLSVKVASLESERSFLEQQLKTQQDYLHESKKQTRIEFENLANEILKAKTKDFTEQTEKSLDVILTPLRERIIGFEKTVDEKYTFEAKERHALKSEIERLINLNDRMTQETHSLTQALRGDSKVQGDWGELVLEKILEASGLREGHEYSQQKSHENDDGERLRPDVVINLPESKHVIVDAKVSLKAYDLYRRSENAELQAGALNSHLDSIYKHIDELSNKHYSKMKGVNSPELVFLFVPLEPAYLLAMQSDPELSTRAWKKNIAIVTATTLLTSLKTVASLWRLENQNRNALEIAGEAAKLYDKFCGFVDDFEKIGKTLETGQSHYSNAMGKLKGGPGNVFRKMELLRELGAAPKNRLRTELIE